MDSSTTTIVMYIVVFFAMMYFIAIRPQQKQQKQRQALLNSLRVRDRVITSGGIYGKVVKVKDNSVMLQIAEKVEIEVAKSGIVSIENREVTVENEKSKKDKKKEESNQQADAEDTPENTENPS